MQNPHASRVATFPAELLSEIFAELPFKGRLYTSHTCRHWRTSSLPSRAKLWTSIASYGRVPGALLAQLERARPHAVSVFVAFVGKTPEIILETAQAIDKHLFHTRLLVVNGSTRWEDRTRAEAAMIFTSFMSSAPMLEVFELEIYTDDTCSEHDMDAVNQNLNDFGTRVTPGFTIPPDLFGGEAPMLQRVLLCGDVEIPRPRCAAFSGVTHLSWHWVDNVHEQDIQAIERSFPLLQRLDIDYGVYSSVDAQDYDRASPLHLQQLYLRVEAKNDDVSPMWLLQHFRCDIAPSVECEFDDYIDD